MRSLTLVLALVLTHKSSPSETFSLENGLTVILRPIAGAKKTAVLVLFNIGSDHDPQGRSGLAHFVEHLYVTGATGTEKARTVEEIFKKYPDGHNAQTGERYTAIASVVPGEALETELADAAARMVGLKIEPADLDRERPRLLDEVDNMFGRIPELGARNRAEEQVRPTPREGRRGGRPDHLSTIAIADLRDHWNRYYKPRNAILVVAGACEPKNTRKWIEKRFAALPAGESLPEPGSPAPPRLGPADAAEAKPLLPGLRSTAALAYAAPAPGSELFAAYLVLAFRLSTQSAKLKTEPGGFPVAFAPLDNPLKITVAAPFKDGDSGQQALRRLEDFVAETIQPDLRPGETERVLQGFGFLLGLIDLPEAALATNPYGVALLLGRSRQMGIDSARLKESLKGLKDEDLRRAAREIFAPDRRGAAVVTPSN